MLTNIYLSAGYNSNFLRGSQVGGAGPYTLRRNITLTAKSPATVRNSKTRRLNQALDSEGHDSEDDGILTTPTAPRKLKRGPLPVKDGVFLGPALKDPPQAPKKPSIRAKNVTKPTDPTEEAPAPSKQTGHGPSLPSQGSAQQPPPPLSFYQNYPLTARPHGQQLSRDKPPLPLVFQPPGASRGDLARPTNPQQLQHQQAPHPGSTTTAQGHSQSTSDIPSQAPPPYSMTFTKVDLALRPPNAPDGPPTNNLAFDTPPQYRPPPQVQHPSHPHFNGSEGSGLGASSLMPARVPPHHTLPSAKHTTALFPKAPRLNPSPSAKKARSILHRQRSVPLASLETTRLETNADRSASVPPDLAEEERSTSLDNIFVDKLKPLSPGLESRTGQGSTVTNCGSLAPIHEEGPREISEVWNAEHPGLEDLEAGDPERLRDGDQEFGMAHQDQKPATPLIHSDPQHNNPKGKSTSQPATMGRPSTEQSRLMQDGFDRIEEQFTSLANEIGYPVARVKNIWAQKFRMLTTKPRGGNGVNHYNVYGQLWGDPKLKEREIQRALEHRATLSPEKQKALKPEPTRAECYAVYREHHQEEFWKDILQLEVAELECKERETVTLQARKVNFESTKTSVCNVLDNASRLHEFEAVVILSGAHHSDKNLVFVYETEGVQGFVEDRLKTTHNNLGIRLQVHASDTLEKKRPFNLFEQEANTANVNTDGEGDQNQQVQASSSTTASKPRNLKASKKPSEDDDEEEDDDDTAATKTISDEQFAQMGSKELHAVIRDHLSREIRALPEFAREKEWKVLHWRRLPSFLAKRGLVLTKWNPHAKVPVSGDDTGKGIREAGPQCSRYLANDCRHGRGVKPVKANKNDVLRSVLPVIVFRPPKIVSRPSARGTRVFLDGSVDSLGPCSLDSDDYIGPPRTAIPTPKTTVAASSCTAKPKPMRKPEPAPPPSPPPKAKATKSKGSKAAAASAKKTTQKSGASKATTNTRKPAKKPAKRKQVGGGGAGVGTTSSSDTSESEEDASDIDLDSDDASGKPGDTTRSRSANVRPRRSSRNEGRNYKSKAIISTSDDETSSAESDDDDYKSSEVDSDSGGKGEAPGSEESDVDERDEGVDPLVQAEEGRSWMGHRLDAVDSTEPQSSRVPGVGATSPATSSQTPEGGAGRSSSGPLDSNPSGAVIVPSKRSGSGNFEGPNRVKKPKCGTAPLVEVGGNDSALATAQGDHGPRPPCTANNDMPPPPSGPVHDTNHPSLPPSSWGAPSSFPEHGRDGAFTGSGSSQLSQRQPSSGPPHLPHHSVRPQVGQHTQHHPQVSHTIHPPPHSVRPLQSHHSSHPVHPPRHMYSDRYSGEWGSAPQQLRNQDAWSQGSYGQRWEGHQQYSQDPLAQVPQSFTGSQPPANGTSNQWPQMQEFYDPRYPPYSSTNMYPPSYQPDPSHQPALYTFDQFNPSYSHHPESTSMGHPGQPPHSGQQGR